MNSFKKSILASSVRAALYGGAALLSAGAAQHAFAQTDEDEKSTLGLSEEVVEVTGIRSALQDAAALKREASTFVDSITASDANSLPDLSVAEALSRIPGITVSRFELGGSDGDFPSAEGVGNLVRGLSFVRSEFNGRDAFSATGGRALDWAAIPPQLIGGVDVYKNQSADLIEGGIGGSINLRTLEPFDKDGAFGIISVDATYTDMREEVSPTFSGIFGNRWNTDAGEFGLLGSYSTSELKSEIQGYQAGQIHPFLVVDSTDPDAVLPTWFTETSQQYTIDVSSFAAGTDVAVGDVVGMAPGFQARTSTQDRERDSFYIAGQWSSPDETVKATLKYVLTENKVNDLAYTTEGFPEGNRVGAYSFSDVVLSDFSSDGLALCQGEGEEFAGQCDLSVPVNGGLFESGLVTQGNEGWTGAYGYRAQNLGLGAQSTSETDDISLNVEWQINDQWAAEFDVHQTTAESSFRDQRIWMSTYYTAIVDHDFTNPSITLGIDPRNQWTVVQDADTIDNPAPTGTNDPNNTYVRAASDQFANGTGDLSAMRADFTYEFESDSWFKSVKFGARYSKRRQDYREAGENWGGIGEPWMAGGYTRLTALDEDIYQERDFSDFLGGGVFEWDNTSVLFIDEQYLTDPDSFYDYFLSEPDFIDDTSSNLYSPFTDRESGDTRRDASYREIYPNDGISIVEEEVRNAYVRFDFGSEFDNGMFLDGNVGVRLIDREVSSSGFFQNNSFGVDSPFNQDGVTLTDPAIEALDSLRDWLPETAAYLDQPSTNQIADDSESYVLPSLNVKLNFTDEWLVRLGASESLTFPNISDMSASQSIRSTAQGIYPDGIDPDTVAEGVALESVSANRLVINGGNTDLKPTIATNLDLSLEWYAENGSYFSATLFHKDMQDIIVENGQEGVGSVPLDGESVSITYSGPINQGDGNMQGLELAGQYFFDQAPGFWSNFGVQANVTFIESEIDPVPQFQDLDADGEPDDGSFTLNYRRELEGMLGISDRIANLVGIYETDKFEARIAYQYRSEYLSSYRDYITGNPIVQLPTGFVDASLRYNITDSLEVSLYGSNLTNEYIQAEQIIDGADDSGQRFMRSSFIVDRRIQLGIQYSF